MFLSTLQEYAHLDMIRKLYDSILSILTICDFYF
jgi:hypothetical protein